MPRGAAAAAAVGAVTLAAGIAAGVDRAWAAWLVASFGLLGVGLAGLLFVTILYASGASWGVALRRIGEAMTAAIPVGGLGVLALVLLKPGGYPWSHEIQSHGELTAFKQVWLWWPFFAARAIGYVLVWTAFARAIVGHSRAQDADARPQHTTANIRLSIAFIVCFAITFSLASFDWIMSLEPDWYSTIFAIYQFAGVFSSGLAVIIVLAVWLRRGALRAVVSGDHLHDLGKLQFAFCTFWMYIWFSQYMLIWYANIPEETVYFVRRMHGAWEVLFLLNVLLNWIVPFFALLRRPPKRNPEALARIVAVVLLGRWLDLYLAVVPPFAPAGPPFGLWEIASMVVLVGATVAVVNRALGRARLVPEHDPSLAASLHYHA